jgi:hypothetical protein
MMKKIFMTILVAAALLSLAACGKQGTEDNSFLESLAGTYWGIDDYATSAKYPDLPAEYVGAHTFLIEFTSSAAVREESFTHHYREKDGVQYDHSYEYTYYTGTYTFSNNKIVISVDKEGKGNLTVSNFTLLSENQMKTAGGVLYNRIR